MPYYPPETIAEVKKVDLFTYLSNYEPDKLKRISNNTYCTREHDSLIISNGLWHWKSQDIGGKNALKYLIKVEGYDYWDAVERILSKDISILPHAVISAEKDEKKLILPKPNRYADTAISYLKQRGIDEEIVIDCIKKGYIYETIYHNKRYNFKNHNVVFVGYDETGQAKYAGYRACTNKHIMGDCEGSTKDYSFRILNNDCETIHLFECPIDLLSYATLIKMSGHNWKNLNYLSLAGVFKARENVEKTAIPIALKNFLASYPNVNKIFVHFDTDEVGRGAAFALQHILPQHIKVIDNPVPRGKDVNDFLLYQKKNNVPQRRKLYEHER